MFYIYVAKHFVNLFVIKGDLIESSIGFFLPISTMAGEWINNVKTFIIAKTKQKNHILISAAGLGNAFSDVAGIGLAHHIDNFCSKILHEPSITPDQMNKPFVGWCLVIVSYKTFHV